MVIRVIVDAIPCKSKKTHLIQTFPTSGLTFPKR